MKAMRCFWMCSLVLSILMASCGYFDSPVKVLEAKKLKLTQVEGCDNLLQTLQERAIKDMEAAMDAIGRDYALLGLLVEAHIPGFVDAYIGPADLKNKAKGLGKLALPEPESGAKSAPREQRTSFVWP